MFSGWVFSRVLLNYRDILALNKLRSYFQICKNGIQTWAENISQFNSFIYTSPSGSVGCNFFQFFCFNFFLHIFFRTWKTWKSDCSDFLRSGKLKIGTNMTKSGQLAGMLLKGTVACYHSSYFGRSRSSHRPPTPPPPPEFYTGFTLNSDGSLFDFKKAGNRQKAGNSHPWLWKI